LAGNPRLSGGPGPVKILPGGLEENLSCYFVEARSAIAAEQAPFSLREKSI